MDEEEEEDRPPRKQVSMKPNSKLNRESSNNKQPINVDDQVIRTAGVYTQNIVDYSGSSSKNHGKRVVSEEVYDHESPVTKAKNRQQSGNDSYDEEDGDMNPGYDTRPIRPKARGKYDDLDPDIDGEEAANKQQQDGDQQFPPGQHPFEGLDNMKDLPDPEQLNAKAR